MTGKSQIWALIVLFAAGGLQAEDTFPLPAELQRDVDFWVDIFTRYNTAQGVLHDNRNLSIVYERIDFRQGAGRRERQRLVKQQRERLQKVLRKLASGKRNDLTEEESRVLALWPAGVSNDTLAAAARRVRHQQGLKDRFREGLIRAGRWRRYIESEFLALGVPIELAALPHVESSYNPDARSHVGASGIWQFTPSTGRRFMRVDHVVDERNDPFAATRAAGRLLAYNYSIAGNWPMAITAYNHGLAGVRRAMRRYGDHAYADIMRNYNGRTFGFASRNFYVAFLAAKHVDQNAEKYFPGVIPDQPTDYATVELKGYLPASELTAALGVTEQQLAANNPALQATIWQGSKHLPKGYDIRLSASLLDEPIGELVARLPADKWQLKQLPDMFHRVARGDTLSEIARAYDTRISTLVALNNLSSSHRIRAGQQLRLPAAGPAPPPVMVATAAAPSVAPEPSAAPEPVAATAISGTDQVSAAEVEAEVASVLEATPATMAGDLAASPVGTIQTTLLSDPSDYSVAADNTIEIHPLETLGHYADWLGIRTQRLRDINGLAFRTPVAVGERIRLDLGSVDAKTFEDLRVAYHRAQQDTFFRDNVITGVTEHTIGAGESIWILSLREYDVPIWLFRQYNPELDLHTVIPGTMVRFPVLTAAANP